MHVEIKDRLTKIRDGKVPRGYKKIKRRIVPIDWEINNINNLVDRISRPVNVNPEAFYRQIGIRSHGKGIFYKDEVTGQELGNKSVYWIEPDCFIVNIVFAWEMAVAQTTLAEAGMIASHRFPMYKPKKDKMDVVYLTHFFKSDIGRNLLGLSSPGGAGRNKTLGQKEFMALEIPIPERISEQIAIANILFTWEKAIKLNEELIELVNQQKKCIMKMLLNQKGRLSGFEGEWQEYQIKDLVDYEQPGRYIANDVLDFHKDLIPVLTANKSFVLGSTYDIDGIYTGLPVIIFDDFTTDMKYVDFQFKVRSSAIKILRTKDSMCNLQFMYELMKFVTVTHDDHKRYYISEYQEKYVYIPSLDEQTAISEVAQAFDSQINLLEQELELLKLQKKGLMQLLLTGKVRVPLEEEVP